MKIFNSLSKHYNEFTPVEPVTLYTCGITPYDTTHLGHAFTYSVTDIIVRYLEFSGHKVIYVQNVTDIDDDILRKAKEVGEDWISLGNRWTRHFIGDMKSLNMRPPDFFPRATDVIPEIIETVKALLKAGTAYERNGNVYYDLDQNPDFGKLSKLSRDEMLPIANERGNHPDDPNKKSPLDFVLWQAKAGDEPAWDNPWGEGRPGWHIECSTMITKLLGDSIDIHIGGADLEFPHHECEIAQVEPITGKSPFVNHWMHVAMVRHNGEKMSKSLGNLIMVNNLLKTYHADTIRIYLGMHHYRESWEHSEEDLNAAELLKTEFNQAVRTTGGSGSNLDINHFEENFRSAMEDDLQSGIALQELRRLSHEIIEKGEAGANVSSAIDVLKACGAVFGFRFGNEHPESSVTEGWNQHLLRFRD